MQTRLTRIVVLRAAARVLVGLIACLLVGAPGVSRAQPGAHSAVAAPDRNAPRPGGVAVAPFLNISAEPADDWMGTGIAETVSADLERLDGVWVVAREALRGEMAGAAFDPRDDDAERTARAASRRRGAAWLVTGGYQRLGDRMSITARVVDTATGRGDLPRVWAGQPSCHAGHPRPGRGCRPGARCAPPDPPAAGSRR
ncbi:MAG: hypothetical protein OXG35_24795 [Acidobacteria bacterium]|nr:hypothetical protein [Acidobacteriota bacterium]